MFYSMIYSGLSVFRRNYSIEIISLNLKHSNMAVRFLLFNEKSYICIIFSTWVNYTILSYNTLLMLCFCFHWRILITNCVLISIIISHFEYILFCLVQNAYFSIHVYFLYSSKLTEFSGTSLQNPFFFTLVYFASFI